MTKYLEQVQLGMDLLASHPNSIFVGQATLYKGHAISRQLEKYPSEKKIEFPVAENMQAGFCLGLALQGYIPICLYPRHDFLLLALDQIITHIDKWQVMGGGNPKVIIKALVGAKKPLDGGYQHTADYSLQLMTMCKTIQVKNINQFTNPSIISSIYEEALNEPGSFLISEYTELY